MLQELLKIALDAYIYGNEAVLTRKQQNECLAAKICEAKYDRTTQAWMVIPRTHFSAQGRTYEIKECLKANACHYNLKIQNYVVGPNPSK